ncbi:MAG: hypothetical protein BWY77_01981 [bacterium ADurb.Bin431]|nr:MAG: hypothetical protein BWY77_01981 [bacterium ADurb.Bin431]
MLLEAEIDPGAGFGVDDVVTLILGVGLAELLFDIIRPGMNLDGEVAAVDGVEIVKADRPFINELCGRARAEDAAVVGEHDKIEGALKKTAAALENDAIFRDDHLEGPGVIGFALVEIHVAFHELPAPGPGVEPGPHPEGRARNFLQGGAEGGAGHPGGIVVILAVDEEIDAGQDRTLQPAEGGPLDEIAALVEIFEIIGEIADVASPAFSETLLNNILGQIDIPEFVPEFDQGGSAAGENSEPAGLVTAADRGGDAQLLHQ